MESVFLMPQEPSGVNAVLLWGLEVIRAIQTLKSPNLSLAMINVGYFSIAIIILFLTVFFWCVDEKRGARLIFIAIIGAWLNAILKILFRQPRPFSLDPTLGITGGLTSGFGLPSGHAQISFTVFVILAFWAISKYSGKKILIWSVSVFLLILIAFSRVYLGVHFPTDIAGGWLVGGITVALFFLGERKIANMLEAAGKRGQLITAAMAALVMVFVYPEDSGLPALLFGCAGGYALLINSTSFSARGTMGGKNPVFYIYILRSLLGMAVSVLVFFGLQRVFPGGGSVFEQVSFWGPSSPYIELGRFVRYGLVGLWISVGAPLLFGNLGLAEVKMKNNKGDSN